jgi:NCS2 family nucleobase:cation symporter-2
MSSEGFRTLVNQSVLRRLFGAEPLPPRSDLSPVRKRPTNLLFDVDETPPLYIGLGVAVQHIFLMSVGWLYIVLIMNSTGATDAQTLSVIRMSMIASGIATILQAHNGLLGSGYLCPLSSSLTFLPSSVLAVRLGGFPLLFGMIIAAGLTMCLFSRVASRLRILFPPEVTGLMVSMSGLQLIALGCPRFVGYTGPGFVPDLRTVLVGAATLFTMVAATVWHRGKLHALPILLGLVVGYLLAITLDVMPLRDLAQQLSAPWASVPHRAFAGLSFRWAMFAPFLIASLTSSLKSVGDVTLCQKINDANWKRTDMKSVSGGILANGLGLAVSGLFGGTAQNTVSSSVGLSSASGMTSRILAVPVGLGVIAFAFFPKIAALFAAMPIPAMGAMLIYSSCFIVLGGFQLLTSRMLDSRRIFAVGIALIFGLSVEISPDLYRFVPAVLQPVFSSSAALATVLVTVLSLVFRIGIGKRKAFRLTPGENTMDTLRTILEEQGAAWGMRPEVLTRAEHAIYEIVTIISLQNPGAPPIEVAMEFDELNLEVEMDYQGLPFELATRPPAVEDIGSEDSVVAMAGYLIRQYADRVRIKTQQNHSRVLLHFEH